MEIFTRDFVSLFPFPTSTHTTRDRSIGGVRLFFFCFRRQNRRVMTQKNGTDSRSHAHSRAAHFGRTEFPRRAPGFGRDIATRTNPHDEHSRSGACDATTAERTTDGDEDARRRGRRCAMTRMHDARRDGSMIMERGNRRNEWNGTRRNEMGWMKRTTGWKRETDDDG